MTKDLLQIGEFAKLADTNLRTLRYYEELGLIQPAERSAGKFRFYSPDQVKRVLSIKRLQSLGLSLHEIQEVMVPAPSVVTSAVDRIRIGLDKQIELVEGRIQSLQSELEELVAARGKLSECVTCRHEVGSEACNACAAASPISLAVLRSMV